MVSGVKTSNINLFSFLVNIYLYLGVVSNCFMFLIIKSKYYWVPDTKYDPPGNWNLSFYVGADILNLLFYITFCISSCIADTLIWYYSIYHFFLDFICKIKC